MFLRFAFGNRLRSDERVVAAPFEHLQHAAHHLHARVRGITAFGLLEKDAALHVGPDEEDWQDEMIEAAPPRQHEPAAA